VPTGWQTGCTTGRVHDGAGVRKGDRVAMLAHNGVEYLDTFFACAKLGAILVGLNWRLHWRELAQLLDKTTPKVLIYSDDFKGAVEQIAGEQNAIGHWLHIEGTGIPNSRYFEKVLMDSVLRPVTTEDLTEEDIACLIFTGGTTGLPKGAQISHQDQPPDDRLEYAQHHHP